MRIRSLKIKRLERFCFISVDTRRCVVQWTDELQFQQSALVLDTPTSAVKNADYAARKLLDVDKSQDGTTPQLSWIIFCESRVLPIVALQGAQHR